jgi:hypothetical protein
MSLEVQKHQVNKDHDSDVLRATLAENDFILADAKSRLMTRMAANEKTDIGAITFQTRVFTQSCLRRCVDLAETAQGLLGFGRHIAAIMTARAIIETVASFCYFEREFRNRLVNSEEARAELKKFLMNFTFSTRIKELLKENSGAEAVQILTQIDKLGKEFKDERIRETYDSLCEYTHPNSLGCTIWYSDLQENGDICFSSEKPESTYALFHVGKSVFMLRHAIASFDRIEEQLATLAL